MTEQRGVVRIGCPVVCTDGHAGRIGHVIVNPAQHCIAGIVVERGWGHADVVVPGSGLALADDLRVQLRLTLSELSQLPSYRKQPKPGEIWMALRQVTDDGASERPTESSELIVLDPESTVRCSDGLAGRCAAFLVRVPRLDITDIVIHQGRRRDTMLRVPIAWVAGWDNKALYLSQASEALHKLPEYRPDHELKQVVEQRLWQAESLRRREGSSIGVGVDDGIVTLRGYVAEGQNVSRAEELARSVRGVRDVKNELIADAQIVLDVAQALAHDPRTRGIPIGINVTHGAVILFGEVSHPSIRDIAEDVAANVPRVRMVFNHLALPGMAPEEDGAGMLLPRPGQHVFATDAYLGMVEKVIISPRSRRVVDFIVRAVTPTPAQIGLLFDEAPMQTRTVVLPVQTIDTVDTIDVILHIDRREAFAATAFDPDQYVAPDPGWEPPFPYQHADVLLEIQQRRAKRADLQAARSGWLDDTNAAGGEWLARGDLVAFRDGEVGVVDHVLLDPQSGSVCHLVVRTGVFFHHDIVIPAEWVRHVRQRTVLVDVGAEQLAALPPYRPSRSDDQVAEDVRQRLQAMPSVQAGQSHIEVEVSGGLIRLHGDVPRDADRKVAEQIAHQTEGIWDVDNQLTSADGAQDVRRSPEAV